jgi:hypothetical protein
MFVAFTAILVRAYSRASRVREQARKAHSTIVMARHVVVVLQKPDPGLYQNVLKAIRATSDEVVFLDQNEENVLVSRPLGLSAICWTDPGDLPQNLRNFTEDPLPKAHRFLESNAKQLHSTIGTEQTLLDNFTQLLILESTNKRYVACTVARN